MNPSADVRSLERLEQFDAALAEFIKRFGRHVSALEAQHSRACDYIERRHTALSSRVADLEELLYAADEETDTYEIEQELEEARSQLEEAIDCELRANEARARYRREAARIHGLLQSGIPQGRSFLQRKIEVLHEILAVAMPESSSPGASTGDVSAGVAAAPSSPAGAAAAPRMIVEPRPYSSIMEFYPLPQGFRWVRLSEIAPSELERAGTIAESGKESYANMKKGFAILQQEILPALSKMSSDQAYEYFREQDVSAPRADGLFRQNVFSAFFGRRAPEVIRLEKRRSDGSYSVVNGYHRIHVAMELGWKAIPADAVEVA
ncbi:MAG: hypothetical protein LAO78_13190 [Acidobacteriia bacterium]|nr:hypothetical protein [Terriglobia bacterium]